VSFNSPEFYAIWGNAAMRQSVIEDMEAIENERQSPILDGLRELYTLLNVGLSWLLSLNFDALKGKLLSGLIEDFRKKEAYNPDQDIIDKRLQMEFHDEQAALRRAKIEGQK